jgi:hypothetical protein
MKKLLCIVGALMFGFLVDVPASWAADYQVATTSDTDPFATCEPSDGPSTTHPALDPDCSLRGAINSANSNSGPDTITFNIPTTDPGYNLLTGWWTIHLGLTAVGPGVGLPTLVDSGTTINGFSQPGGLGSITSGQPGVIAGNPYPCSALVFERPNVAIDANKAVDPSLTYPGAPGDVMSIDGAASDITIMGLSIYDGFGDPDASVGIAVAAHAGDGVNRIVDAMFIGLLPDGSDPGTVERNWGFGVQQYSETDGNIRGVLTVKRSYVGYNGLTGINGQRDLAVVIATSNEVFENGWFAESQDGIDINGVDSLVKCNISRDNKTLAVPNGGGGSGLEVGSQTSGDPLFDNNIVKNNSFYDNVSGAGISIRKGADGNLVERNVIHDNLVGISVNVEGNFPTNRNRFNRNSTYLNMYLGIDLEQVQSVDTWLVTPDEVTPNDGCGDGDGGDDGASTNMASNDLQNYPDLTSADRFPNGQVRIRGTFASRLLRTYILQFFATPSDESMGADREGKTFIGELTLVHDQCPQTFETTFAPQGPVAVGDRITVTATRYTTATEYWSTSEYGGADVFVNQLEPVGKVTGGGYITPPSPACASPCTPSGDTRANFGFIAQYKNHTDFDPQGHINFVWSPAKLHMGSVDYTFGSLVVNRDPLTGNGDARWRGSAKVNKQLGYCFEVYVQDKGEPGTLDTFHLRIWRNPAAGQSAEPCASPNTGTTVYDNNVDSILGGGNIQIHHP